MSDQIAHWPLVGPIMYNFGSATPADWPQSEYVSKADYGALAAELAAQIEDCTVNYNQRVLLTNRVEHLEAALQHYANWGGYGANVARTALGLPLETGDERG